MSALAHTASHELLLATLEDEHTDLNPAQVRAALQQAGGDLAAARHLCRRQSAESAAQAASSPQQRQWWPQSDFGARALETAAGRVSSSSSSRSSSRSSRLLLVPHHVVPAPRQPAASSQTLQAMQPSTKSGAQPGLGHQPAATALPQRRMVGSGLAAAPPAGSTPPSARSGLLRRAAAGTADEVPQASGQASSSSDSWAASLSADVAPAAVTPPQEQPAGLHPHYAAVFLTDKSRQALLQYVAPLHEVVSADHMTITYKPTPAQCAQLPLGQDAALFVAGVASDYRAQAVAVQHPSWLPYTSEAVPHVTVSVGEEVPAKEAGDVTAAALKDPSQLAPVARLKLLQGVVGVQLSDGTRVFSVADLQARLAQAAAAEQQRQAAASVSLPVKKLILQRGAKPVAAVGAVPGNESVPAATAGPAPAGGGSSSTTAPSSSDVTAAAISSQPGSSSSSMAPAWDLDSLMDQLHIAEQPACAPSSTGGGGGHAKSDVQAQLPRRGLLKLPAAVAAEMAAPPRAEAGFTGSGTGSIRGTAPPLAVRRPQQKQQQQQQIKQRAKQHLEPGHQAADHAGELRWREPEAAAVVLGKSVADEAAEASAGDAPLDMVSSLAFLLPSDPAGAAQAAASSAAPDAAAGDGGAALFIGQEAHGRGVGEDGGLSAALGDPAAGAADPEVLQLLQLQFPGLHGLVVETALRMHGGSLPAATQFLFSLDQQQSNLAAQGSSSSTAPQQPTLGAFLQHVLPEAGLQASSSAAAGGLSSSGSHLSFADSSFDMYQQQQQQPDAGGKQRGQPPASSQRPSSQASAGRGGRGSKGGRTAVGGRRVSTTAGDDPMSSTERQAMNLHLSAKRLYTQAAQEAYARGQVALSKEMQGIARSHGDAATSARRRANASAFRSTNASVLNTFTLDLHGQHVEEALQSLERYLVTLGGLGHPGGVQLQVITGLGRHSVGNQPRVLPAVVRYLSDAGYKFDAEEDNPGLINVLIGC